MPRSVARRLTRRSGETLRVVWRTPLLLGCCGVVAAAACSPGGGGDSTATTRSAVSTGSGVQFFVTLPVGAGPSDLIAATSGDLRLAPNVTLIDEQGPTTVANAGPGVTAIGQNDDLGDSAQGLVVDLVSAAPLTLDQNSEVTGFVVSSTQPSESHGARIDGKQWVFPQLFLADNTWSVTFPTTTQGDVQVGTHESRSLTPGAYGNVSVDPNGTLTLAAGQYTFASLQAGPSALVQSDTTSAPLVVYVQTSLSLQSSISPSGGPSTFLLGYAGNTDLRFSTAFAGTLVAPNAAVELSTLGGGNGGAAATNQGQGKGSTKKATAGTASGYAGAFFAASLDVDANNTVVHVPFGGWSTAIPNQGSNVKKNPILARGPETPPPALSQASDVPAFLAWAYGSLPDQIGDLRRLIRAQDGNESIGAAIVTAINSDADVGENLVAISLLGETRTQAGFKYFSTLLGQPLPTTGTTFGLYGDPAEWIALAKLQARAVDGLAMMRTVAADLVILGAIKNSQSIIVRSRAVNAYLFIHGADGRAAVSALLSADEQILMDRLYVASSGQSFDARLSAYQTAHPEVVPSTP